MVPPELLGTERSKTEGVGSCPMILKSWKAGEGEEFEKNPAYFKKDTRTAMQMPYLDGIRTRVYGDPNSLARRVAARTRSTSLAPPTGSGNRKTSNSSMTPTPSSRW